MSRTLAASRRSDHAARRSLCLYLRGHVKHTRPRVEMAENLKRSTKGTLAFIDCGPIATLLPDPARRRLDQPPVRHRASARENGANVTVRYRTGFFSDAPSWSEGQQAESTFERNPVGRWRHRTTYFRLDRRLPPCQAGRHAAPRRRQNNLDSSGPSPTLSEPDR